MCVCVGEGGGGGGERGLCGQVVKALDCQSKDHRFKSHQLPLEGKNKNIFLHLAPNPGPSKIVNWGPGLGWGRWVYRTGKWKTLKCGNRSTETEVRKRKYGSEKKTRLLVAWLTNVPCRQRVTVSKRCESQVLIHWTPASTQSFSMTQCVFWSHSETTVSIC